MNNRYYRQKIKLRPFDIAAGIIAFILTYLLIWSVIINDFVPSWKTTVVYGGFFALATAYIVGKTKTFPLKALPVGALAVLSSISFALHRSPAGNALVFIMIMLLSGIYCIILTSSGRYGAGTRFFLLDILKCEVLIPLRFVFLPFMSLKSIEKPNKEKSHRQKLLYIIAGLLLSIPVCFLIVNLLMSGDAAFEALMSDFAEKTEDFFARIVSFLGFGTPDGFLLIFIPSVIFTPYIFSVMFSFRQGICNTENRSVGKKHYSTGIVPQSLSLAFMSVISVIYAVFLFSQTSYFFSAFRGRLPKKFSLSDYAVRGFTELMAIAAINLTLIALTVIFAKRNNEELNAGVKGIVCFLGIFTLIITSTSIAKIVMYVREYGLTEKRLFGFLGDVGILMIFLCILFRLFIKKFPYMKIILSLGCILITVTGLIGAENIVADYNVSAYLSGKLPSVDTEQLLNMNEAGALGLFKLVENAPENDPYISEAIGKIAERKNFALNEIPVLNLNSLDEYLYKKLCTKHTDEIRECEKAYIYKAFLYVNNVNGIESIDASFEIKLFDGEKMKSSRTAKASVSAQDGKCLEGGKLYVLEIEPEQQELGDLGNIYPQICLTIKRTDGETFGDEYIYGNTAIINYDHIRSISYCPNVETAMKKVSSIL